MKFSSRLAGSTEERESLYKLQTFFNYFKAIDFAFEGSDLSGHSDMVKQMKALNGVISRARPLDSRGKERLRQSLFHSWNSRLFLHQYNDLSDEFIALSLQWLPTMYYYALYQSVQSYFRASGKPDARDHAAALNAVTAEIGRFPGFLSSTCKRITPQVEVISSESKVCNIDPKNFSNLSRPDKNNCFQYIAKFLVTTRKETLEYRFVDKRKSLKRKALTQTHKQEVDGALKPISIFHFFYRMRKRFNYEEGDLIHQGDRDQVNPKEMYRAIRDAYSGVIIAVEWLIGQYVGKNNLINLLNEFKRNTHTKVPVEQLTTLENQVKRYFE